MTVPADSGLASLHPVVAHHIVNTLGWHELRPLQAEALGPLSRGEDALLLAPTAGGKTEAAVFALLSRMATESWQGLSVLYVCPLRALLNNLEPRLSAIAAWLGRSVGLWHGDTPAGRRRAMSVERPDIMLTTPESLEAMLVSTRLTPRQLFADLRVVVVDEVHAFAGDDRGWHLLAVLERLSRIAGRPLQRIGLSATVGNPEALLHWLQGGSAGTRPATVVAPDAVSPAAATELSVDFVGTIENAATVIAAVHRGEKRLVFADSRRTVEDLALALRAREVTVHVSHSSLSPDERKRSEAAFAESRDCVIVSTSTLELGIDVGDLDRVIQIGAPGTVASFLQRLGRTGRRPGLSRNTLFLAVTDDDLLRAGGLLRLWGDGFVEPVLPPVNPRHLLGQQLLALCLQEGRVGSETWQEWLGGLALGDAGDGAAIAAHMIEGGLLDTDSGMIFVGPEAEQRYGRKHFLELLSVFTANPQFLVMHGRQEIGSVDPMVLTRKVDGPRILSLAGRAWRVTHTDWKRRHVFVETTDLAGRSRWFGLPQPLSFALTDAMRRVVLDDELPGVTLTRRATARLAGVREEFSPLVDRSSRVLAPWDRGESRWWTWAGARANACLADAVHAADPSMVDLTGRFDNRYLRVTSGVTAGEVRAALDDSVRRFGVDLIGIEPSVSTEAVKRLKFADLLPLGMAARTVAARDVDLPGAACVIADPVVAGG